MKKIDFIIGHNGPGGIAKNAKLSMQLLKNFFHIRVFCLTNSNSLDENVIHLMSKGKTTVKKIVFCYLSLIFRVKDIAVFYGELIAFPYMVMNVKFRKVYIFVRTAPSKEIIQRSYGSKVRALMYKWIYKFTYRFCNKILIVSPELRYDMLLKKHNNKISFIPNFLPTGIAELDEIAERSTSDMSQPRFCSVGRDDPQKDFDYLAIVASTVRQKIPTFEITIFGDVSDDRKKYLTELSNNGLFFAGNVRDLQVQLRNFDCFVTTSKWEGTYNSFWEAYEEGLYIIGRAPVGMEKTFVRLDKNSIIIVDPDFETQSFLLNILYAHKNNFTRKIGGRKGRRKFYDNEIVKDRWIRQF